jgi:para-aminobenzoate synthetase component 2
MTDILSSDILEQQFGPTEVEILSQDDKSRTIRTKVIATGHVLEESHVVFDRAGITEFPLAHSDVLKGRSIGKAFRDRGIKFTRLEHGLNKADTGTVINVSILVGPHKTPYAEIVETYSPAVVWPEPQAVLLIDNYDSFTYNLYQQISALGRHVRVAKHDAISLEEIRDMAPSHIVISPGPKRPEDSGISLDVIGQFHKSIPILGVCLGMQCIGAVFGSQIVQAPRIMHGKTDDVLHGESGLFAGVPNPFTAARYHSLIIETLPGGFQKTAWSQDGSLMAIQHDKYPVCGVQFHPESFMTEHGETIMRNFLT